MTDATRIATLEAQLEVVAADRDQAREMLRDLGRENAKLRANLAVTTEAYRDHRAALMAVTEDAPSPATPSEERCLYGVTVCTHAQCQGSGRATPTLAERLKSPTLRSEIAKARARLDAECSCPTGDGILGPCNDARCPCCGADPGSPCVHASATPRGDR